jgi:exopolyphosphatase/guanosine-5'-triphosphate,3'-diphosphate pyrophosphatase
VTRCAVVDIGSNSIHLLIADRERGGGGYRIRRIESPATLLGLGRTVGASGRLDDGAARELGRVVTRQVKQAERAKVTELHVVATAAVRQAADGRSRMAALAREIGAPIRILTARREAELGFIGLVDDLDPQQEQVTIDGGGASTEVSIAHGRRRGDAISLPVGGSLLSVTYDDPPTAAQLDAVREHVEDLLDLLPRGAPLAAVATGGSARKLPLVVGGRSGQPVDLDTIERALTALRSVPSAVLAKGTGMQRRRVQSLAAGAIILGTILRHYRLDHCRLSPRGIREGILIAAADEPDYWWVDVQDVLALRDELDERRARSVVAA